MTTRIRYQEEKTWLDRLEEFLVDEFHFGLERVITETIWASDVRVGAWTDSLQFFECLNSQHENLIVNHARPAHLRSHFQLLNFSGQATVNGLRKTFLSSQVPCNRQKVLLLHSLRLILENKDKDKVNLSLIVPILRREIHQCIRLIFFHLKESLNGAALQDFIDRLDQHDWLEMRVIQLYLADYLISWLEDRGVKRGDVDDLHKLGRFFRTMHQHISYKPHHGEPVDFEYGHVFEDWNNVRFFSSLHQEIERCGSLIYLEGLSHNIVPKTVQAKASGEEEGDDTKAEKRKKGGTHYQNLLAIHYLLRFMEVDCSNIQKAKFASFLTGFSDNTLRQQWSNIHWKRDENGVGWSEDMRTIREYFEGIGLTQIVAKIDSDLDN
jgi:hypothetical protein